MQHCLSIVRRALNPRPLVADSESWRRAQDGRRGLPRSRTRESGTTGGRRGEGLGGRRIRIKTNFLSFYTSVVCAYTRRYGYRERRRLTPRPRHGSFGGSLSGTNTPTDSSGKQRAILVQTAPALSNVPLISSPRTGLPQGGPALRVAHTCRHVRSPSLPPPTHPGAGDKSRSSTATRTFECRPKEQN